MAYFDEVKLHDEVYSMVYGHGKVKFVLDKKVRTDGFYIFQVQYDNDSVFYTEDGIPQWCTVGGCKQTVFYKADMEMLELDYQTIKKDLLSKKKIAKLKAEGNLEMRAPSGAWINVDYCPPTVYLGAIKYEEYYLFRKAREA